MSTAHIGQERSPLPTLIISPYMWWTNTYIHTYMYIHPPYALTLKMEAVYASETLVTLSMFTQGRINIK